MIDQSEVSAQERECLAGRIGDFYRLLNNNDWAKCFELVDPKLRDAHRVDLPTYSNSLSSFFSKYGPLTVLSLNQLRVYVNVPNKLRRSSEGLCRPRSFATGDYPEPKRGGGPGVESCSHWVLERVPTN
jgi:hypothetical protein